MKNNKRQELINSILSTDATCLCEFKYSVEYLESLSTNKLLAISKNPTIKIYEHDKQCYKQYKHSLTIKHCVKCNKEISKQKQSNICSECERKEQLTFICKNCGQTFIVESLRKNTDYCNTCISNDILFKNSITEYMNIESDIRNKVFNHFQSLSELFFIKFFNKENKSTYSIGSAEFKQFKAKQAHKLFDFTNNFINHLIKFYTKNNWDNSIVSKLIFCLNRCLNNTDGYIINANDSNMNFELSLPKWKSLLQNDFNSVITALQEFKFSGCEGSGEFFWTLINTNIQCNYLGKSDALYLDNTVGEIKSAQNKTKAGRLLFKRDSWFGSNDINTFKYAVEKCINSYILHTQNLTNEFINFAKTIDSLSLDMFTWNNLTGYFHTLLNLLCNNKDKNEFIKLIFNLTINFNFEFKPRFSDIDLTNKKNFKVFHFVNYCLYYMLEDAKSENLDKLIFISETNVLILKKDFLLTCKLEEIMQVLTNWEIAFPDSGLTKDKNESHDRNKNRAPGIYFKKN